MGVDGLLPWLLFVGFGLTGVSLMVCWRSHHAIAVAESAVRHIAARQRELVLFAENYQQLIDAQDVLEGSVEGTTATIRAVHKGIASIPFGILEAIPATRDTTKVVRGTHDLISNAVYGGIGLANRLSGKAVRKGLRVNPDKAADDEGESS